MQQPKSSLPIATRNRWNTRSALADNNPPLKRMHLEAGRATEDYARFVAVDLSPADNQDANLGESLSAPTLVLGNGRVVELSERLDSSDLVKLVVVLERVLEDSGAATRIYLARGASDMRIGFNGLLALVRSHLACDPRSLLRDPQSGYAFVFSNAQRNQLKVLYFDRSGLWVSTRRIEKGRLHWPEPCEARSKIVLSHEECGVLLEGIDLTNPRRQRWRHDERN